MPLTLSLLRIKPVQKVEGMTNGMGLGAGQQQPAGLSDISSQVQQYQQFLGEPAYASCYS